jgi:hypothetical protein
MVRIRSDVDGCGCLRCQQVDAETLRRSLPGTVQWSGRLVLDHPSIVLVFLAVGTVQLLSTFDVGALVLLGVPLGIGGVFVGRGYIGVIGRERLANRDPDPTRTLVTVLRRVPAFVGAAAIVLAVLLGLWALITVVLAGPVTGALGALGLGPFGADVVLLVCLALAIVYALVKFWFVPEACFIGGYGPVGALRVSWQLTTLHRRKAVLIVAGFGLLLGIGVALETQLGSTTSLLTLTVTAGDTEIVLRSFGLPFAGGFRFAFNVAATALYSGVFAHQYVSGVFER